MKCPHDRLFSRTGTLITYLTGFIYLSVLADESTWFPYIILIDLMMQRQYYTASCVSQMIAVFLLEFSVLGRNTHLSCARSFFSPNSNMGWVHVFQVQFIILDNRGVHLPEGLPRFAGSKMQFGGVKWKSKGCLQHSWSSLSCRQPFHLSMGLGIRVYRETRLTHSLIFPHKIRIRKTGSENKLLVYCLWHRGSL